MSMPSSNSTFDADAPDEEDVIRESGGNWASKHSEWASKYDTE